MQRRTYLKTVLGGVAAAALPAALDAGSRKPRPGKPPGRILARKLDVQDAGPPGQPEPRAVKPVGERITVGEDPASRARARFEDGNAVARLLQLVGGSQAGQARTEDQDLTRARRDVGRALGDRWLHARGGDRGPARDERLARLREERPSVHSAGERHGRPLIFRPPCPGCPSRRPPCRPRSWRGSSRGADGRDPSHPPPGGRCPSP